MVVTYPLVPKTPELLTPSEQQIIEHLMNLESNREIAQTRGTSVNTVGNQISSIFEKLSVNSRAELAWRLHQQCARCARELCEDCPVLKPDTDSADR